MYDDDDYVVTEAEARGIAELLKSLEYKGSPEAAAGLDQALNDLNSDELQALADQFEEFEQESAIRARHRTGHGALTSMNGRRAGSHSLVQSHLLNALQCKLR